MSISDIDSGFIELACSIVSSQTESYVSALMRLKQTNHKKYLFRVKLIEKELRTQYYQNLTMGTLDAESYISSMHMKYGIPLEMEHE